MTTNRMGLEQEGRMSDDELKRIADDDHVQCGDASAMARELLAYREASKKPVGYVDGRPAAHGGISWAANRLALDHGTKLYAAPSIQADMVETTKPVKRT